MMVIYLELGYFSVCSFLVCCFFFWLVWFGLVGFGLFLSFQVNGKMIANCFPPHPKVPALLPV